MKGLVTVLSLLLVVAVGNAQTPVTSFQYSYAWTGGAAFTLQADGHTYLFGGDGHWNCFRVGTTPGWVVGTADVSSNVKDAYDTLFVVVDAGRNLDRDFAFSGHSAGAAARGARRTRSTRSSTAPA